MRDARDPPGAPVRLVDLFHGLGFLLALVAALALGRDYLVPIAVAVLVWFLINAVRGGLLRALPRLPFPAATAASVGLFFGLVVAMISVIANNVAALGAGLVGVDDELIDLINRGLAALGLDQRVDLEGVLRGMRIEDLARAALGAARTLASDAALVFLYVMFLLIDQRYYEPKLRALAPDPGRRRALRLTLARIGEEVRAYLWLMTLISAGVGLGTWAICAAFGVAGAGFWGFLAFALNFIPTIGSISAVAFPAIYALLQFEGDAALLGLVGALSALQFVAGEVVLPRVMGDRLNLSSFVILLSLVVWGAMWGPAGMFLAIPIMVILTITLAQFPRTRPVAAALSKAGGVRHGPEEREDAAAALGAGEAASAPAPEQSGRPEGVLRPD
jgi:predicted PurR-regulated permease PerM